jgi:hypothetical protein
VPKQENFSLVICSLCEPIWVCDLGTGKTNIFFYQLAPDLEGFWFFVAYTVCSKKEKKLQGGQNQKLAVVVFGPI